MTEPPHKPRWRSMIELARPVQWAKGVFVLIGPVYAMIDPHQENAPRWLGVACALAAFSLAASGCYVINDIRDRELDKAHPRKKSRPIASGRIPVGAASVFASALLAASLAATLLLWPVAGSGLAALGLLAIIAFYILNVSAYSLWIKRIVMLDVISLAAGFVLRVIAGCVAAGIDPSIWLLNTTFFVSMFLAFGKRLGERRMMGDAVTEVRGVQAGYTSDLLRMAVVVTAVATLLTYAGYVQDQAHSYPEGPRYLLWLTLLPATYSLLRCFVVLEWGRYDDPTELAVHDRPFQAAVGIFGILTGVLLLWSKGFGLTGVPAG